MAASLLDASAVLAVLFGEAGGERVMPDMSASALGAVNLSEVVSKLIDRGCSSAEALALAATLTCEIVPLDEDLALRTGALRRVTRSRGLSLGDRACLALAEREGLPVLTADRTWATLDLPVEVVLIR